MITYLHTAAIVAEKHANSSKRYCLGCVAVRRDGAVVESFNHDQPERHFDHHAEARALRKCGRGAVLYIARILKSPSGLWANARPCPRCQALIRHRGVKRVYYTLGPGEYGCWTPTSGRIGE